MTDKIKLSLRERIKDSARFVANNVKERPGVYLGSVVEVFVPGMMSYRGARSMNYMNEDKSIDTDGLILPIAAFDIILTSTIDYYVLAADHLHGLLEFLILTKYVWHVMEGLAVPPREPTISNHSTLDNVISFFTGKPLNNSVV